MMRNPLERLSALGLLILGMAAPVAAAPDRGACGQIRLACQSAGFVQGAAREGIGLQVHCIMPIMQGRNQPPAARKPLPTVNPQLVSDCAANNARFGRPRFPSEPAAQQFLPNPPAQQLSEPKSVPKGEQDNALPSSPSRQAIISALPIEDRPETGPAKALPAKFRRTMVDYSTSEPAGTIIIDTPNTYLYLTLGNGKAMRYGIGVGREGFTWSGTEKVTKMAEWPDWHPPEEMIERQPYLPRFMAGGEGNPLGARALYLGQTLYRIHGTNQPSTIGTFVSSGCIRLTNEDVADLYGRVHVGTRVMVMRGVLPASVPVSTNVRPTDTAPRPKSAKAEKPAATPAAAASPSTSRPEALPRQAPTSMDLAESKGPAGTIPPPATLPERPADDQAE